MRFFCHPYWFGIGISNFPADFESRSDLGDDWKKCKNRYEKIINGELTNVIRFRNGKKASLPSVPPTHEDYESQMAEFTNQMLQSQIEQHLKTNATATEEQMRALTKRGISHPITISSLSGGGKC
jgi:hypothetical protein